MARKYLMEYADDDCKLLRETTVESFAGDTLANIFLLGEKEEDGPWALANANENIRNVWGESEDKSGRRVWIKQDLRAFYKKCMEYRSKLRSKICSS